MALIKCERCDKEFSGNDRGYRCKQCNKLLCDKCCDFSKSKYFNSGQLVSICLDCSRKEEHPE